MSLKDFTVEEVKKLAADSCNMRELCRKLGYASEGGTQQTVKRYIAINNIDISHFTGKPKGIHNGTVETLFVENSAAGQHVLREGYTKGEYTPYKCAICGQPPEGQGKPLTLTLDHINGKNHDDRLENLRGVCPNCDRQLDTYGSRNKTKQQNIDIETGVIPFTYKAKEKKKRLAQAATPPDREELKNLIWTTKNYTEVGRYYDISTNVVRKWCEALNLPKSIEVVKNTTEEGWISENWNDKPPFVPRVTPPKPVNQIDIKSGEIIASFNSLVDAGLAIKAGEPRQKGKKAAVHISDCCKGKRASAYGYKWSWVNSQTIE